MKKAVRFFILFSILSSSLLPLKSEALMQTFENAYQGGMYPDNFTYNQASPDEIRNAVDPEASAILKMNIVSKENPSNQSHCTAFFIKNKDDKPLLMSARHCARFHFTQACQEGRLKLVTEFGQYKGTCSRVIAENEELDEVAFEATFDEPWEIVKRSISFLTLSAQLPRLETPLKMLGYPASLARRSQFTFTKNCWVHSGRAVGFQDLKMDEQAKLREWQRANPNIVNDPNAGKIQFRKAAQHNCSIYGGNSGGPIVVDGTKFVLGLPTTYYPGSSAPQSKYLSAGMDSTYHYIMRNLSVLKNEGVRFAKPYGNTREPSRYSVRYSLELGKFQCYETLAGDDAGPVDESLCGSFVSSPVR